MPVKPLLVGALAAACVAAAAGGAYVAVRQSPAAARVTVRADLPDVGASYTMTFDVDGSGNVVVEGATGIELIRFRFRDGDFGQRPQGFHDDAPEAVRPNTDTGIT